jgi:hypothetical protein
MNMPGIGRRSGFPDSPDTTARRVIASSSVYRYGHADGQTQGWWAPVSDFTRLQWINSMNTEFIAR